MNHLTSRTPTSPTFTRAPNTRCRCWVGSAVTIVAIGLLFPWLGSAQEDRKIPVAGVWRTENGGGSVEIRIAADGGLEGFLLDVEGPDDKNPDQALRTRPLKGARLLWGFHPTSRGGTEWAGGKIYDPESGNTYSCRMRVDGEKLRIRGFVGLPLFGRTTIWTRAPVEPAVDTARSGGSAQP